MSTTNRTATAGYFTDRPRAEIAVQDLRGQGYGEDEIDTAHYARPAAGQFLEDPSGYPDAGTLVTVGGARHADALPLLERAGAQTDGEINTTLAEEGSRRIKLYAEQLSARKTQVQTGEVTLRKEVITEEKSLDVPVMHEEVVIERHAVNRAATAADFRDETISVPVMAEQVTLDKTAVVTGEVSLGKRQVTETAHLTDTVRHEELVVDGADGVDVVDRADKSV